MADLVPIFFRRPGSHLWLPARLGSDRSFTRIRPSLHLAQAVNPPRGLVASFCEVADGASRFLPSVSYWGHSSPLPSLYGIDIFHFFDRLDERGQVLGVVHRDVEAADGPLVPGRHDDGAADIDVARPDVPL